VSKRGRGDGPVGKKEVVPALGHNPAAGGQWPRTVRRSDQVLSHGPVLPH
jgi:hypothetical protein